MSITSFLILVAVKRCLYYHNNSKNKYNIFTTLINYEPYLGLIEIILSTIPIYFASKSLQRYSQILVNLKLNLSCANKKIVSVFILTICHSCILITLIIVILYPTSETIDEGIDGIADLIQSIFRLLHLFHFFVAFNRLFENLKTVETNLKKAKLEKVFVETFKVLETYDELGNFYEFFMLFTFLEIFYDTLTGVKKLEDLLFHYEDFGFDIVEASTVFWWLFQVPLLILVLHEGHLLHEKVKILFFLSVYLRLFY